MAEGVRELAGQASRGASQHRKTLAHSTQQPCVKIIVPGRDFESTGSYHFSSDPVWGTPQQKEDTEATIYVVVKVGEKEKPMAFTDDGGMGQFHRWTGAACWGTLDVEGWLKASREEVFEMLQAE